MRSITSSMSRSAGLVVALIFTASFAAAADRRPEPHTYGTASPTIYPIPAADFAATSSEIVYITNANGGLAFQQTDSGVQGPPYFVAPVRLPAGANIGSFEVEACLTDQSFVTASYSSKLQRCSKNGCVDLATAASDVEGCDYISSNVITHTVDNYNFTYRIAAQMTGLSTVGLHAVRVFYKLQVAPAPQSASFADVPTTHSQFRYIEALKAAGITAGCGDGNYCPGAPITRGQMAVFLSLALGLHWPN